jgi:selenocysteine lyase/cysteine desulfurase
MSGRRRNVHAAMAAMAEYEAELARHMLARLAAIRGLKIYGITAQGEIASRVPTFSFTIAGKRPADVAAKLGADNIFVWDGNFYAQEVVERLGLTDQGGLIRVGLCHYNTTAEIDRLCGALAAC